MGIGEQFEFEKTGRIDPEPATSLNKKPEMPTPQIPEAAAIRLVIVSWLGSLRKRLSEFSVTTHGCLFTQPPTFHNVLEVIEECGKNPGPCTVSTVCQYLDKFFDVCDEGIDQIPHTPAGDEK